MIYEYPENFIVSVIFSEDLVQKRNETHEWNMVTKNKYEKHDKYNMIQEIEYNDDMKCILSDIDEEYAVSKTLGL